MNIERLREFLARRLITFAKLVDPGNKTLFDARAGWSVNFAARQTRSPHDTCDAE